MEAVPGVVTVSEKERVRVSKRHTNLSLSDVRRRPVPSVVRSESGRLAALVGEGVVFLDDEGKQQLVPRGDEWYPALLYGIAIDPQGRSAFVQNGPYGVVEADFVHRTIKAVFNVGVDSGKLVDVAPLDHDNLFLLAEKKLVWVTRIDEEWIDVDAAKLSNGYNVYANAALNVAVVTSHSKAACQVWSLSGKR
jgi:hypothetical protein